MPDSPGPLVTLEEAAAYLSVDPRTVRRLIADGYLEAVRIGPRLLRIRRESLEQAGTPIGGVA